jgi:glycosyltransferase involved in cell wall biosynthesis
MTIHQGIKNVALIMPAYNEQVNIGNVIAKIRELITDDMELIVVDDGSVDSTAHIVKAAGIRCLSLGFNAGYGVAIQTGVKYALNNNFELAVLVDADGQHHPEEIFKMLYFLEKYKADVVIGSRFLKETGYKGDVFRRFGGNIFSLLIYLLGGIKINDPTSGLRVLNRKALKIYASDLFSIDFPDADMILLLSFYNLKIMEIPVRMSVNVKKSMHSGLRHILYYVYKVMLSILVVLSYKWQLKKEVVDEF